MSKLRVIKLKRVDIDYINIEEIEIEDKLADFYEQINCDTIDIVSRTFNGVRFDIICDDEALFKSENVLPTSWWQQEGYTPDHEGLFGTLLICHSDNEGNLLSVNPNDILNVGACARWIEGKNGQDIMLMFHGI